MRLARFKDERGEGLVILSQDGRARGLRVHDGGFPGDLATILARGDGALKTAAERLRSSPEIDLARCDYLPPIANPGKIICIGLNYADHSAESGYAVPDYPTFFGRFTSSLIGHGAPIVRPVVSEQLDFEGELAAIIGRGGRNISREDALSHVAGYSPFNDGSIRDYQHRTPQWTAGKNFDETGAFGPLFVSADELPPGCRGLRLTTRLNGNVVQQASIDDLIFDVATLVSLLSEVCTLQPGDVIVTGTPAGIGAARKPPLWMKPGDVCEVDIEGVGLLVNPIADQRALGGQPGTRS
ncbi:fumarylacetoacetate hydrolase family protein [Pendulispora rubella]|uniref:Fumarylacetoacetate hydrolase family protein n=1 Tax=Pendulispora rubella TaxID=2741070 RepID=A0ABZ2KYM7_9BACT